MSNIFSKVCFMDSFINSAKYSYDLKTLVIFRNLLKDSVVRKFMNLLESVETKSSTVNQLEKYADFVSELYKYGTNLTSYILNKIFEDENVYVLTKSNKDTENNLLLDDCVIHELDVLNSIARIQSDEIKSHIDYSKFLPNWETSSCNFTDEYLLRVKNISAYGYGIFAKYHMFIVENGEIVPIKYPDDTTLEQLIGYERERKIVIDNTKALIDGKPASNILLYGDAGTGKSSTVKAVVNRFADRGLRIIQMQKKDIHDIPKIMDSLNKNPLKFIMFIDDLSFSSDDSDFSTLKAILEGNVSSRANNVVIYATSNRRHLVKESFSDREGDDIHFNDTVQELTSLSERFGISVKFMQPSKKDYLNIVHELAKANDIQMDTQELDILAERFVISRNGRSPRSAKQFIMTLKCKAED
ncbi:MAG: ATP-binding protein [Ruminococcus sp.]|nr:ATP-binding protein [Ruminococcus sp.]